MLFDKKKFDDISNRIKAAAGALEASELNQDQLAARVESAMQSQADGKRELEAADEEYDAAVAAGEDYLKSIERGQNPPANT